MPKDQTICIVPEIIYDANSGKSYTKGKLLGKGTFGKCYEIRESQLHRTFAGKIVGKAQITKSNHRETMTQEISIHRTLNHKNVVGFYDFFDDLHNVYMILELCRNRTMLELHLRRKALAECETRYYMKQILEGVNYLHQNKIIHRDLKLANLFLNDDLQVKIGDFGLATKLEHEGARSRTDCGTLDYMAPEILAHVSHSYEVDIWSIGCIMYILLVGKTPFEGFSTTEIISRIQLVQYKIPSTVNRIPRNMITNMLQGNPSKRPSIEQLIANPFFTCGFMPLSLPLSCLTMAPRLDMLKMHNKSKPPSEMNTNVEGEGQDFVFRVPVTPARKIKPVETINDVQKMNFKIKKMLETLTEQLAAVLKSEPGRETTSPADEITDPSAQPVVWISKWVDHLEKFGFGYQLSDDGVGVIYNDGTRLIMLANCFNIHYINREGYELYYTVTEYPPDLEEKMKIMNCFLTYMKEHLMKAGSSATVKPCDAMSRTPYVYQWFRTQSAVIMQLTNGTVQINFLDHTKIIMCPLMAAVTHVDKKNFITYKFQTIQENGCCIELANKLIYAYEKLVLMLSYP